MLVRKFRRTDVHLLREIHKQAGYGFPFPRVEHMEIGFTAEDNEQPIGFVGAELRAEITGMFAPEWGSPHERMKLFASLHLPVAEALELREVPKAYCFRDPKFPRFGERLRELGWAEAWTCYSMDTKDCIKALRRRA